MFTANRDEMESMGADITEAEAEDEAFLDTDDKRDAALAASASQINPVLREEDRR